MNKLLVVEDEAITSDLLRRYFEIVGYDVINALTGREALKLAKEHKPAVVILDIMLPDMDGYEVCKQLRADENTDRIPILFLTQKDERRDRLDGLGLGADDYITKPFDIEELRLRVHNIIARLGGVPLVDARTSLPNMDLIRERLPKLLKEEDAAYIDVQIIGLGKFARQYGPIAANQVIRSTAKLIGDLLHEIDPTHSFIGHPRDDHFLIAFGKQHLSKIEEELPKRYVVQVKKFYDYEDQQRGKMKVGEDAVPFMSLKLLRVRAEALRSLTPADAKEQKRKPEKEKSKS